MSRDVFGSAMARPCGPHHAAASTQGDQVMTKQSGSVDVQPQAPGDARSHGFGWPPLATLRDEIDRLFDDVGGGLWRAPRARRFDPSAIFSAGHQLAPVLEVVDRDGHYEIKAELPGLSPADIDLHVDEGTLTISGEITEEKHDEKGDCLMSERHYGAFRRHLNLPKAADTAKITAVLAQGLLTITIPKTAQASDTARKIAVKAG
jgi:HSP20 family protein